MEAVYGIIDIEDPIACARDVLGTEMPVRISGVAGRLLFPQEPISVFTEDRRLSSLRAPHVALSWKRGEDPLHWGGLVHSGTLASRVEKLLLIFDLPASDLREKSTLVHRGYAQWWSLFNDYLELTTKQRRVANILVHQDAGSLDLFRWRDNKADRPYEDRSTDISIRMQGDEVLLTQMQLRSLVELSSNSTLPPEELKVQLEAYRALRGGDFRKAVIETAVSAELVLTRAIQARFASDNISYGSRLLQKFRMLGGRLELAGIVGVTLPDVDFRAELVDPRNEVIHRADFASEAKATRAIEVTDKLLESAWPDLPWKVRDPGD